MGGDSFATGGPLPQTRDGDRAAKLADPGRASTVDREHPTRDVGGNAGIDAGGKAPDGPGMFLADRQRTILLVELNARIIIAEKNDTDALHELRDEFKSQPEFDYSALGDLAISLLVGNAATGTASALKRLLNLDTAKRYVQMTRATNVKVDGQIQTVQGRQLENVIRGASVPAQAQLRAKLTPQNGERAEAVSFADWLRDTSTVAFQHLREDPIGVMTDAQLLVYFASWEGSLHTTSHYKLIRGRQIREYLASHASEIGRKNHGSYDRETYVAWIKVGAGEQRMLFYVGRDFGHVDIATSGALAHTAYGATPQLSYTEGPAHVPTPNEIPGVIGVVEPQLVDVALERHRATWQSAPEGYTYDTSKGAPRLLRD